MREISLESTSGVLHQAKQINPFDEIAVEESLRIKEKVAGSEVVLVSVGAKSVSNAESLQKLLPKQGTSGRMPCS